MTHFATGSQLGQFPLCACFCVYDMIIFFWLPFFKYFVPFFTDYPNFLVIYSSSFCPSRFEKIGETFFPSLVFPETPPSDSIFVQSSCWAIISTILMGSCQFLLFIAICNNNDRQVKI